MDKTRIDARFAALKAQGRTALVTFITAGDPDADLTVPLMHALVEAERLATAEALPSRKEEFLGVKIEGIRECAELLVVTLMPGREKHLVGRRLLPEMDVASVGCAIQNMWLAARAEGIGLGWVSFFAPEQLAALLDAFIVGDC